jgi:thioredoxin 1
MFNHRRCVRAALLLLCLALVFCGPAAAAKPPSPKPRPAILEFGRETCPICKRMEEVMARIKKDYGTQVEVRILYVERQEPLYRHYGIVITPTQVFLDASGKEVFRHEGELTLEKVVKKLKELKWIN